MYKYYNIKSHQGGVVLLVGLMLLVIMTIIGLVAIRGTTQQEKMSASNQQQTQTFQAAEAAIRQVMAEVSAKDPAAIGIPLPSTDDIGEQMIRVAIVNGKNPPAAVKPKRTPEFESKSGLSATATVELTDSIVATGSSIGQFWFCALTIESSATQAGTGAVSQHTQGIAYVTSGCDPEFIESSRRLEGE